MGNGQSNINISGKEDLSFQHYREMYMSQSQQLKPRGCASQGTNMSEEGHVSLGKSVEKADTVLGDASTTKHNLQVNNGTISKQPSPNSNDDKGIDFTESVSSATSKETRVEKAKSIKNNKQGHEKGSKLQKRQPLSEHCDTKQLQSKPSQPRQIPHRCNPKNKKENKHERNDSKFKRPFGSNTKATGHQNDKICNEKPCRNVLTEPISKTKYQVKTCSPKRSNEKDKTQKKKTKNKILNPVAKSPNDEKQSVLVESRNDEPPKETNNCEKFQNCSTHKCKQLLEHLNKSEDISSVDQSTSKDVDIKEFDQDSSEQYATTSEQLQERVSIPQTEDIATADCNKHSNKKLGIKNKEPKKEHSRKPKPIEKANYTTDKDKKPLTRIASAKLVYSKICNKLNKQPKNAKKDKVTIDLQSDEQSKITESDQTPLEKTVKKKTRPERRRRHSAEGSHVRERRHSLQPRRIVSDETSERSPQTQVGILFPSSGSMADDIAQEMQQCYEKHKERYTSEQQQLSDAYLEHMRFQQLLDQSQEENKIAPKTSTEMKSTKIKRSNVSPPRNTQEVMMKRRAKSSGRSRSSSPTQEVQVRKTPRAFPRRPLSKSPEVRNVSAAALNASIVQQKLACVKCVTHEEFLSVTGSTYEEAPTRRQKKRSSTTRRGKCEAKTSSPARSRDIENCVGKINATSTKLRHQSKSPCRKTRTRSEDPKTSDTRKRTSSKAGETAKNFAFYENSKTYEEQSLYSPHRSCTKSRGKKMKRDHVTPIDGCHWGKTGTTHKKPQRLGRSLTQVGSPRRSKKRDGKADTSSRHKSAPVRTGVINAETFNSLNLFDSWVSGGQTDLTVGCARDNIRILDCCLNMGIQADHNKPEYTTNICSRHFGCAWVSHSSKKEPLDNCCLSLQTGNAANQELPTHIETSAGEISYLGLQSLNNIQQEIDNLRNKVVLCTQQSAPVQIRCEGGPQPTCGVEKTVSISDVCLVDKPTSDPKNAEIGQTIQQELGLQLASISDVPLQNELSSHSGPSLAAQLSTEADISLTSEHAKTEEKYHNSLTLTTLQDETTPKCHSDKSMLPKSAIKLRGTFGPATSSAQSWIKRRECLSSTATSAVSSPAVCIRENKSLMRKNNKTVDTVKKNGGACSIITNSDLGACINDLEETQHQIRTGLLRPQRRKHHPHHPQCYQLHHLIRHEYQLRRKRSAARKQSQHPGTPGDDVSTCLHCNGSDKAKEVLSWRSCVVFTCGFLILTSSLVYFGMNLVYHSN